VSGGQLTVGVVTPHAAAGPEVEIPAMTHGRVVTVLARTGSPSDPSRASSPRPMDSVLRASTEPDALVKAAALFRARPLAAVAHASTTTGYLIGRRAESALVRRLAERCRVPAVASCAAAAAALRTCGAEHIQLVHPPWFDDAIDDLGVAYFRGHGFDVAVTKAVGLSDDPACVRPEHVVDWVERHVQDRADAVFLAGNGFRAAAAVEELERRTGRLVLAANQGLLWGILAATDTAWDVEGQGRALRTRREAT
jgi:maleate isomerase